jgi:hypothetical protein
MNARNVMAEENALIKRKQALNRAVTPNVQAKPVTSVKAAEDVKMGVLPNPPAKLVPKGVVVTANPVIQAGIEPKPRTVYDIQREKISAEAEREKQRRIEALKRKMAAQGQSGSGVEEKALRALEQDISRGVSSAMQNVEGAEAQSTEEEKQREEARLFEESMLGKKTEAEKELIGTKTGAEKELIGTKTEAEKELIGTKTESEKELIKERVVGEKDILDMKTRMEKDIVGFKNDLEKENESRKLVLSSMYDIGKWWKPGDPVPGTVDTPEKLAAFNAGRQNQNREKFEDELKAKEDYRLALITSLDPDSKDFVNSLKTILTQLGYKV